MLPLFFCYLLAKNRKKLEDKEKMMKYGDLYKDKNVASSWNHRAWALPLAYFYRRTAFAIVTVFVFDWPNI